MRRTARTFPALVVILCAGATLAWAADYYVAPPPEGDDGNSGTFGEPFATFNTAIGFAGPGDTIWAKDGLYREVVDVWKSGTPGAPITFRALNPGQAVVDGGGDHGSWSQYSGDIYQASLSFVPRAVFVGAEGMAEAGSLGGVTEGSYFVGGGFLYLWVPGGGDPALHDVGVMPDTDDNVFVLWDVKYITFRDLVIQYAPNTGIFIGADVIGPTGNVQVTNCLLRWNWLWGSYVEAATYCTFTGNTAHENCLVNWDRQNSAGGWPMGLSCYRSQYIEYDSNVASHNHGEGIGSSMSSNITFTSNTCYDNFSVNLYVDNCVDVLVDSNLVYVERFNEPAGGLTLSTPIGIGASDEDYGMGATLDGLTIINNISIRCSQGISYWTDMVASKMQNWKVANNTIVDSRWTGITVSVESDAQNVGNVFYNNIVKQDEGNLIYVYFAGDMVMDNNLYLHTTEPEPFSWLDTSYDFSSWKSTSGQGTSSFYSVPQFLPGSGYVAEGYKVSGESDAVENGVSLAYVPDDYGGTERPQGSAFDIGAFEHLASPDEIFSDGFESGDTTGWSASVP